MTAARAFHARVIQMKEKTVPHANIKALNAFFVDGRGWGTRMVSKANKARGKPKKNLAAVHQFSVVIEGNIHLLFCSRKVGTGA